MHCNPLVSKLRTVALFTILASLPSVGAEAVNAASYRATTMPGGGVAQGSIFVLFGSNVGPSGLVWAPSLPLQTRLAGTSVRVTVGSQGRDALIVYTSPTAVAAILPSDTPLGNGQATVTYNGRQSNPAAIRVVQTSFGIFSSNERGYGPAVVQNILGSQATLNSLLNSMAPGQTGIIWGTGLGPISSGDANQPPVGNLSVTVKVLVGGKEATVLYQGRSPEYPGIDQINFIVPSGPSGCYVPVAVKAGGVVSNYTSISVDSAGGKCSDQVSYAPDDLSTAERKGEASVGSILLSRQSVYASGSTREKIVEQGQAVFVNRPLQELLWSRGPNVMPITSPGTCSAVTFRTDSNSSNTLDPGDSDSHAYMSAGSALAVYASTGSNWLLRQSDGGYSGTIGQSPNTTGAPLLLEPGPVMVLGGRSGDAVGSFQARLQLPRAVVWNAGTSTITVSRSKDLTVTWSGGDPAREVVFIRGESTDWNAGVRGVFTCIADLSTGHFTIPADVLGTLPASVAVAWTSQFPGMIEVGTLTRTDNARFTAPGLTSGYMQVLRTTQIEATYR